MARRRKKRRLGPCEMPTCKNDAFYVGSRLCQACYAYLRYWQDRSPTDVMQRRKDCQLFITRLDTRITGGQARRRRAG
jgi:hypothetical protein